MAKTNMVEREKRRGRIVKKYAAKRAELKEPIRSPKSSPEERAAAQAKLQALPRDASPTRQRNRCAITGRSRGVYRKFGLARVEDPRSRDARRDSRASPRRAGEETQRMSMTDPIADLLTRIRNGQTRRQAAA